MNWSEVILLIIVILSVIHFGYAIASFTAFLFSIHWRLGLSWVLTCGIFTAVCFIGSKLTAPKKGGAK